jgi:TPR repeat protein
MYHNGYGVLQDYKEAIKWYHRAAEQGSNRAQYNLGLMYDNGYGVPQNYVKAHMWYNIAGLAGETVPVSYRDSVALEMTSTQVADAQRLASEWIEKHPYTDKGIRIVLQTKIPH